MTGLLYHVDFDDEEDQAFENWERNHDQHIKPEYTSLGRQ